VRDGFLKAENAGGLTGAFRHNKLRLSYVIYNPRQVKTMLTTCEITVKVTPCSMAVYAVINQVPVKNGGCRSQTVNHALL
jgi:hypothetical protein